MFKNFSKKRKFLLKFLKKENFLKRKRLENYLKEIFLEKGYFVLIPIKRKLKNPKIF